MKKLTRKDPSSLRHQAASSVAGPEKLLGEIRSLIQSARGQVAQAVNAGLVMLYWNIGRRIRTDILQKKRAEYGEAIVPTLSAQLLPEYGEGFGHRNMFRMIRFAEVFPRLSRHCRGISHRSSPAQALGEKTS